MRVEVYVYDGRALLSTKRDREGKRTSRTMSVILH
jgi:YD repeat-containing protein